MSPDQNTFFAAELRTMLTRLGAERLEAKSVGLDACDPFMQEINEEIATCSSMYVLAAVTEIASLRAEVSGALEG